MKGQGDPKKKGASFRFRVGWLGLILLMVHGGLWAQYPVFEYKGDLPRLGPAVLDTTSKEVEIRDLDGDGWLDIYVGIKQPGQSVAQNIDYLYHSQGNVTLALADDASDFFDFVSTSVAFKPATDTSRGYDVEFADINGDGNVDMIRPDYEGLVYVFWGMGDGTFHKASKLLGAPGFMDPNGAFASYDDVDVMDLDGDNDLDFILAHYPNTGPHNLIFENLGVLPLFRQQFDPNPQNRFNLHFGSLPAEETHSVSIGDVDGDGAFDVALANQSTATTDPKVFFGTANPFVFDANPLAIPGPGSGFVTTVTDLVDLNDDQLLDVYIAQFETDVLPLHGVYFHSGNNANPYPNFTDGPSGSRFYDARYGDLNDDGRMEIIVININAGDFGSYFPTEINVVTVSSGNQLNDATETFFNLKNQHGGIAVDLGDLDQDGDDDVVFGGVLSDISNGNIGAAHVYENRTKTKLKNVSLTSGTYIAIVELTADTNLTIPTGGSVTFKSGESIVLGPGFSAAAGSQFTATTF